MTSPTIAERYLDIFENKLREKRDEVERLAEELESMYGIETIALNDLPQTLRELQIALSVIREEIKSKQRTIEAMNVYARTK